MKHFFIDFLFIGFKLNTVVFVGEYFKIGFLNWMDKELDSLMKSPAGDDSSQCFFVWTPWLCCHHGCLLGFLELCAQETKNLDFKGLSLSHLSHHWPITGQMYPHVRLTILVNTHINNQMDFFYWLHINTRAVKR